MFIDLVDSEDSNSECVVEPSDQTSTNALRKMPRIELEINDLTNSQDDNDDGKPSKNMDDYWIFAKNPHTPQLHTPRTGKWLLFVHVDQLDATWELIRRDTEDGMLGITSKTATAKPNPLAQNPMVKVICVYTYDYQDQDDVMRVRERLKYLGWVKKIPYKADEDTLAGNYAHTGPTQRISKYYA